MLNLNGKWALITGASRGIGHELAVFMAKQGCNLILHSRDLEHTKEINTLVTSLGIDTRQVAADLSDLDAIESMLHKIDNYNLTIDIIFNNAGIQIAYRPDYYSTPDSDYEKSFLVNTIAPMKICYHFIPKMLKNNFGRIINTTSGIMNEPEQAGYSASKAALDKVTADIASRLTDTNVIVTLTDPGWCRTDLGSSNAPNDPSSALPGVALGAFTEKVFNVRVVSAQEYSSLNISEALEQLTH